MFSFVFICQVNPTSCQRVKPLLARLAGDPQKVGQVVDDALKPRCVQISQEFTDFSSILCVSARSSQFSFGMSNYRSPVSTLAIKMEY